MKTVLQSLLFHFPLLVIAGSPSPTYGDEERQAAAARPNIVLIYADDLGYGDVGCYGATKVSTPNIDRLAREGRMLTDAHSASAVCTPSRYSLLTGEYGWRIDCWGPLAPETPLLIDTKMMTVPRLLKQHGYSTACIGKWHLGFGKKKTDWNKPLKPGPLEIGFDYYYGVPHVNSGPPFVYVENHHVVGLDPKDPFVLRKKNDPRPPSPVQVFPAKAGLDRWSGAKRAHRLYRDEMIGTMLTQKAVGWIRTHVKEKKDKPFFMYLATTNIHHPFTPHPRFKGTSQCGRYGDFIHELDWIVGEVLRTLDELKVADNTLVIFTSDNGGMLNYGGQDAWTAGHRLNGDLLGFKFGVWEGGHRVPFIARWPGTIPAGSESDEIIVAIDLLPTFAKLAGAQIPSDRVLDGMDVSATLLGKAPSPRNVVFYIGAGPVKGKQLLAVRVGKWKLHVNGRRPVELYDLESDIGEKRNVLDSKGDLVQEMLKHIDAFEKDLAKNSRKAGWVKNPVPLTKR